MFALLESVWNLLQNLYDITHLTSDMLIHYHGKLKTQISGRMLTVPVSRNFFNSLLTPCFVQLFSGNSSVNLFAVYPFRLVLITEHHVDCWQTLQLRLLWRIFGATNWSQKYITKRMVTWKILSAISVGKDSLFKHRKYPNLWMNNKVRTLKWLKMQFVCIYFHVWWISAENLNF